MLPRLVLPSIRLLTSLVAVLVSSSLGSVVRLRLLLLLPLLLLLLLLLPLLLLSLLLLLQVCCISTVSLV
jgi:hypothetical protein